ncbi:MAG: stage II sporulation protein M [Methanomicrobiaceae archaeon]|uniref:Integral membrane protein n=1 Tax=hydrocarbon metagenome TaxID=938273 RepID=A0A0W8FIK2_9ZZZZ|nr:stage II sporulation protein M [Methanomicrobiaceae archaeon]MDD5419112.1 stage II sporulation protein M [Methanomicrobiaceae archaeon]
MYRKELLRPLAVAVIVFAVALGIGIGAVRLEPALGEELLDLFRDQVAGIVTDANPLSLAVNIFLNNLGACILLFLGGASFGILTGIILGANGILIGAVLELVRQQQGLFFVAAAILPHGIFEIPGFLIAGALGLHLGRALLLELQGLEDAADTARRLGRYFVRLVVPLLLVAAGTEAFITPALLNLLI